MEWNRVGRGRGRGKEEEAGREETFGDVFRLPVVALRSRSLSRECESKERERKGGIKRREKKGGGGGGEGRENRREESGEEKEGVTRKK